MDQVLVTISLPDWLPFHEIPIRGYGAMLALGFLAAILVAVWRARREGVNPDHVYNGGILALLGGIVGARLFDVLEYSSRYPDWTRGFNIFDGISPLGLIVGGGLAAALAVIGVLPVPRQHKNWNRAIKAVWALAGALVVGRGMYIHSVHADAVAAGLADPYAGFIQALMVTEGGLTVYGGLILATLLVVIYLVVIRYREGVNPLKMVDIFAPSMALGLAFGRMGCFLNGCCYGGPSNLPWAFTWPVGSIPWQAGMRGPIHPAQLYGVVNGLLMFLVLHLAWRWKKRHGVLLGAFFVLKAVSRFLLEMLRADEAKTYFGGLSISQSVSLFVIVGAIFYFLWLRHTKMSSLNWQPSPALAVNNGGQRNRNHKK